MTSATPAERSGHVWLASYPKSGNTWLRVLLANLLADGDAPVSINALGATLIASARSLLDMELGFDTADLDHDETDRLRPLIYEWIGRSGVAHRKVHDAYQRLPDGRPLLGGSGTCAAVYVIRNPLDVAISYMHHMGVPLDEAIDNMADVEHAMVTSRIRWRPQARQRLLSWSGHVESWVDEPSLRLHVVRYEDLLATPEASFGAIARFLELPDDPARLSKAWHFSRFEELQRQEAESGFRERSTASTTFFRSGRAGAWRDVLQPGQVERIIAAHGRVMRRFGYLDDDGQPV